MATDSAETSSPQSLPAQGSEVRLTRLHDALKQLKAKSAATASVSTPPIGAAAPIAAPPRETAAPIAPAPQPAPFRLENWLPERQLEQYRRLADNVALQFPAGRPAAIAVLGADAWHDAAAISLRLAACLADRRQGEALCIECGPSAAGWAEAATRAGLIDVAAGRAVWRDAIVCSALPGLSLLGGGSRTPPEDLPIGEQWRAALQELRGRFGYIVFDARPGECPIADAWLAAFDGAFLVVGLDQTPRRAVQGALAVIRARGARLAGCIALD